MCDMTSIAAPPAAELAERLLGELIGPEDADYDKARQIWNAHIQRRPALIARCRDAADVMAAVRFGREHDLLTSIRGGGHAVAGHAIADGGLVIDLSAMTGTRVDPAARTIRWRVAASIRISIAPARYSGWPRPAASSAIPVWAGSPLAVASGT